MPGSLRGTQGFWLGKGWAFLCFFSSHRLRDKLPAPKLVNLRTHSTRECQGRPLIGHYGSDDSSTPPSLLSFLYLNSFPSSCLIQFHGFVLFYRLHFYLRVYMHVCLSVWLCECECRCLRGQKRQLELLEQESQGVEGSTMWSWEPNLETLEE